MTDKITQNEDGTIKITPDPIQRPSRDVDPKIEKSRVLLLNTQLQKEIVQLQAEIDDNNIKLAFIDNLPVQPK